MRDLLSDNSRPTHATWLSFLLTATIFCCIPMSSGLGQEASQPQPFEAASSAGVTAKRDNQSIYLEITDSRLKQVRIPRIAAALKTIRWDYDGKEMTTVSLQVEQEEWIAKWPERPADANRLVLTFDNAPLLPTEIEPIQALGDGSFHLPACYAITQGDKVRYEPQTFKNTVGYWVGAKDSATWEIQVDAPGVFNIGILQGCGSGQGGSTAGLSIANADGASVESVEFQIKETGHFQNFQWQHVGVANIDSTGTFSLKVQPVKVANKALVDIRAIHLVRLPASAAKQYLKSVAVPQ